MIQISAICVVIVGSEEFQGSERSTGFSRICGAESVFADYVSYRVDLKV